ncbi:calcium-binding protein [Falsiroseomonas sp.]|uniref:calcium-binding protein n=1 Tax=Falsiroseomonas sp. TaxID=2870721 RepID=UPI003F705F61
MSEQTKPILLDETALEAVSGGISSFLGTEKADTLEGTAGMDAIIGLWGNDLAVAGAGRDFIDAGPGNDTVVGGADADNITAGDGNDRILWAPGEGNDTIQGGNGADTLVIEGQPLQFTVDALIYSIRATGGTPTIEGNRINVQGMSGQVIVGWEMISFSGLEWIEVSHLTTGYAGR